MSVLIEKYKLESGKYKCSATEKQLSVLTIFIKISVPCLSKDYFITPAEQEHDDGVVGRPYTGAVTRRANERTRRRNYRETNGD